MELLDIRLLVGSFLDNHTLTISIRVCRDWYDTLVPLLYTMGIERVYSLHWESFQPHLHHLRDLRIALFPSLTEQAEILNSCRNLNRLRMDLPLDGEGIEFREKILELNPNLVRVQIHAEKSVEPTE